MDVFAAEKRRQIWQGSCLLWVGATLSFMAAMSVSSVLFMLISLACIPIGVSWRKTVGSGYFLWATLALILTCSISLIACAIWPPFGVAPDGFGVIKKYLYFVQPLIVGWALLSLTQKQGFAIEEHPWWKVFLGMAGAMACVAIFQFWAETWFGPEFVAGKRFFRPVSNSPNAHAQGLMFFHLSFASAMCFAYAFALARFFWPQPGTQALRRLAWLGFSLLLATAVIYTYSRIAWFAVLVVLIFMVFLWRPRWALLASGLAIFAGYGVYLSSEAMQKRWNDVHSFRERREIYRNAISMFEDRPWVGVGFAKSGQYADHYARAYYGGNKYGFGSHAHNNPLEMLSTTGIPGFLAWCWWFALLFYYAFRRFRRASASQRWLPAGLLAGGVAFQVNGLTQVNFLDAKSQHSMVLWAGIILALAWREHLRASSRN